MPDREPDPEPIPEPEVRAHPRSPLPATLLALVLLSAGFVLLLLLMEQRPQFVGEGLAPPRRTLVQEAPSVVIRLVGEDVSSHRRLHPVTSNVRFELEERPDPRGLETVHSMEGELEAEYTLENPHHEPAFVLFHHRRPRAASEGEETPTLSGVALVVPETGERIDRPDAWIWTGELGAGESRTIGLRYRVPRVASVAYHVPRGAVEPLGELGVEVAMDRMPPMRFTSHDGTLVPTDGVARWRREGLTGSETFRAAIVEDRSLFGALHQLLQTGPILSALFLVSVLAVLQRRREVRPAQILTIAAAYGFYFPLLLYLAAKFRFAWALPVAFAVPGCLHLNYARRWLGVRMGVLGGLFFLLVFQVFPTCAAFAGWNRGMVLLCVGAVTLSMLVDLQNRQLERVLAVGAALLLAPDALQAQDAWLLRRVDAPPEAGDADEPPVLLFGIVDYRMRLEERFVSVELELPFEVLRPGTPPVPLFGPGPFLSEVELPELLRLAPQASGLGLIAVEAGAGRAVLRYRAPLELSGERIAASVPLALGAPGRIELVAREEGLEFEAASLWTRTRSESETTYVLGTDGRGVLRIGGAGESEERAAGEADSPEAYGIGITTAEHLTVLHSDGSALLLSSYRLPGLRSDPLELELPEGAEVISLTLDGLELERPVVEAGRCRVRLDARGGTRGSRTVGLRLDLGRRPLGFFGMLELALPSSELTTGSLSWAIAFPEGFESRVRTRGLEHGSSPASLSTFGALGEILRGRRLHALSKELVSPGALRCRLRYRQVLPGVLDEWNRGAAP